MVPCTCSASFAFIPSSISLFLCHVLTPLHLNPSLPLQQGSHRHQYHSHMAITACYLQVLPAFKCIALPTSASHIISKLCCCVVFPLVCFCLFRVLLCTHLQLAPWQSFTACGQIPSFLFHSSTIQSISLLQLSWTSLWGWVKANFLHIDWYWAGFSPHANLF